MVEKVQIGPATLYCGDNAEVRDLVSRSVAVVTDPPYGINWRRGASGSAVKTARLKARRNEGVIFGDDKPFNPDFWIEFNECILFGANHFANRLPIGAWHAWDKLNGWASHDFNSDVEFIWSKQKSAARIVRHLWKGVQQDSEKGVPKLHISQKPIYVMEWCINLVQSKTIFDPYMGSGTTGVAALKCGREFIGVEIQPQYFDAACKRIEDAYAQPDLFVDPPAKPQQTRMDLEAAE